MSRDRPSSDESKKARAATRSDGRRRRAAELADELRAVCDELAGCEASEEALDDAVRLARELRGRIAGPRRPRWYDGGADTDKLTRESRGAYLDQSPIRGELNPIAPPLVVSRDSREDGRPGVAGRARLGMAYEGPPHGVHGGWVAALFDDLLGSAQGLAERPGVTAKLTVRYRHVTPLGEPLRFAGWIERDEGRRIVARATCHAGETLTADAEGLFVRVDFEALQERMRARQNG